MAASQVQAERGPTTARRTVATPPRPRRRDRWDAVSLLTLYLVVSFAIPSPLIFKPLGGAGTPADLLGLGFLLWWAMAKIGSGQGVDRGRQPVRIALLLVALAVLCSVSAMFLRSASGEEISGAYRGLVMFASLFGVALLAADGISSLERLHTLLHRFVTGTALVAAVGLLQWVTGYNPAASLHIPGLVRNLDLQAQGRSDFVRVQSTTLHPIELGGLLGMALPLALVYAFGARDRRSKVLRWLEVAIIAVVIPMALSRTGVIAAAVGLLAVAMDWTWRRRLRVAVVGSGLLVALRLAIPGLVGSVISLFSNFSEDSSTQDRAKRWSIAGHYFEQRPWFGMGLNTFYPATQRYYDDQFLAISSEMGAAGLAAFILLFLIMAGTARVARLRATDPATRFVAQALAGVAVAEAVMFLTADMFSFVMELGMFFLLLGATGAMWRLTGGQQGGVPDDAISVLRRTASTSVEVQAPVARS